MSRTQISKVFSLPTRHALISLLTFVTIFSSVVILVITRNIPFKVGNSGSYGDMSVAQSAHCAGIFLACLAALLTVYSVSYGIVGLKSSKTYEEKWRFWLMIHGYLGITSLASFILCIKNLCQMAHENGVNLVQWFNSQRIPIFKSRFSSFAYVMGCFGFLTQFAFIILNGIDVNNDDVFSYNGYIWLTWWYMFFTSLSNWLLFIYYFLFVFFNDFRLLKNNTFLIMITTYMMIVGIVYNILLGPDDLESSHPGFWYYKNYMEHGFSFVYLAVFATILILSGRYRYSIQSFWMSFAKIYGFGIAFITYLYIIPFTINASMYSFSNINPEAGGELWKIVFYFIIPFFAFGIISFYYLLNKFIVIGDAFIWFKLDKNIRRYHLDVDFIKKYIHKN